ncbi:phage tail protein [Streptococcus parasanguinis]|uniref:phage tail protein n=1 Tax=Streptococcus parasanguinis TaxID=1318 RepID=UPI00069D3959|nr:phage tail protein [Streptococcus parasanguinis]
MITFYDEKGNGYGAQVELKTKNAVNGERSISGTIVSNKQVLSKLDRGWSFTFDGELYKIIYAKPKDEGKNISLSFDAVHQFFYDFEHSNCYKEFNGSNRFEVYIEEIFKDSGYRYVIEAQAGAIRKENFGNASRLKMFKEIIKAAGLEFSVTGKVVRILKKVGTDLSTVVRKNFNMNELTIEKNIGNFITYKKGLGAWKDEKDHDMGRYTSEYESPLARIYGRIEGEPVSDERYKETGKLLERLKKEVDESYSISVQLDMEDLTQAGYKYTRPREGDYIMAINETIGFREKIRIVSYESSYDVTGRLLSHKVTCNDIGTVQKAITSEGSIMRSVSESKEYAEGALEVATRALVSANGKNTNYYGATKPKDEPRGTLHEGDLLYLTVGEETELYYWSGSEWLPKILKVDTSKIEKIVNDAQNSTNQAIAQANAKAEEALKKAGTLPDTSKLSDQIKQQVLNSPDLQNKVTEGVKSVDGDTIYSKIVSKVSKQFATRGEFESIDRVQNDQGRDLLNLSKQITAQTLEFNKLTESNKMYERILGKSETGAPDQLSRLVMSSQIFQTEVGKYSSTGGPNMLRNSRADDGLNYWTEENGRLSFTSHQFYLNGQKRMFLLSNGARVKSSRFLVKRNTNYMLNLTAFDTNTKYFSIVFRKRKKGSTGDYQDFDLIYKKTESPAFNSDRAVKKSFSFNTGNFDEGYLMFFYDGNPTGRSGLFMTELDLYEGSSDRLWQPSPDDSLGPLEAVRTQVTQLAGSWSVKNISSAGDVLNSINLLANGTNRIDGRLTHITGQTVIDEAVIDSANLKKVSASKISGGEADFSTFRAINVDAGSINTGTLRGINIRGVTLGSIDESFMIDTPKNEIRFDNHTLLTFYNKNDGTVSMIGSGNRASNTQGSGLLIGVDIDSATATRLKNQQNNRDLWTARTGTATSILMGTRANGRGVIEQLTTGEVSIGISEVKTSTAPQTYIKIGNINNRYYTSQISMLADFLNIDLKERLLLNTRAIKGTWQGDTNIESYGSFTMDVRDGVTMNGHGKGFVGTGTVGCNHVNTDSLRVNKIELVNEITIKNRNLATTFNALVDFVVAVAKHAGWTNIGNYKM